MPTESKFDDLDLREQPAGGEGPIADVVTHQNTCQSILNCASDYCCYQ